MKNLWILALAFSSLLSAKEYQRDREIPPQAEPYFFGFAKGLAVRANGDLYAAGRRIVRMDAADHVAFSFPAHNGIAEFHADGLAADAAGNVYAADDGKYTSKVVKFGPAGNVLWSKNWAVSGAICVDPSGAIFLAGETDAYPYLSWLEKWDADGNFLFKFGATGADPEATNGAGGLWCDGDGNVYAASALLCRVAKFDNNGNFLMMFGSCGTGPAEFFRLRDVTVDSQGDIYTFSWFRVQKFAADGRFITQWGEEGDGDGQFKAHGGIRIAAAKNGAIYTYDDNGVQKWTRDGAFIARLSSQSALPGRFNTPAGVAFSNAGELFAADRDNHRLQKFDRKGALVAVVGSKGGGNGRFNQPRGVAVSDEETVFVADTGNNRIQVFNKQLEFVTAFGGSGMGPGQFDAPTDIAADRDGNLYVVDSRNLRVQKFDKNHQFVAQWPKTADLNFLNPSGIGVDNQANVYVADEGNRRICKFDAEGNFLLSFGRDEPIHADFDGPSDAAVDNAGRIFVADGAAVRVFDPLGQLLHTFGEGAFGVAFYLDLLNSGDCLVSDPGRDQIVVYSRSRPLTVPAAGRTAGARGTLWRTDLGLLNTEAAAREVTAAFYASGMDNTAPATAVFTLQPSAPLFLPDLLALFGVQEGAGALGFFPAAGDYPLVFSRTYHQAAEGTYGQFVPGAEFGATFGATREAHLIGLKSHAGFRSNVGFVNLRDGPLTLHLTLYDAAGDERSEQEVALEPYSHLQINDVPNGWGIDEAMEGGRLIARTEDPDGRFAAYASIVDNASGDPVFIPAAPPPPIGAERLAMFLPVAARAAGAYGSDWKTELTLANAGTDAQAVRFVFWEHDISNTAPRSAQITVEAGETVMFGDALGELFGLDDAYGPLLIRPGAAGLIAHGRIYHTGSAGTYGQFIPTIPEADLPTTTGHLTEYNRNADQRTNIGLINFTPADETFLIELLRDGRVAASEAVSVDGLSHTQFPGPWNGTHDALRITPQSAAPSYFAYASLVDNRTQDPVFQPAR